MDTLLRARIIQGTMAGRPGADTYFVADGEAAHGRA
jgi:hypothetical protein